MTKQIKLPHNLDYRDYQKWIVSFLRNWGKRALLMYHRRGGKDKTMFNLCIEMAIRNPGWYAYVLPTYAQGKKIIWDSIDKEGRRFKDHIPKEILVWENGTELKFTFANGSFIQILGSENIDSLRGIAPRWIVFSEYAFQNPTAWEVMRPILAENWWWAIFNSTPNWKNHFYDMYNMANDNPDWYCQRLTVKDTNVIPASYIEEERRNGMSEEMIQQEYFCSFDVGAIGSYYAKDIEEARRDGRITKLPINRHTPFDLYFDLGVNDNFTISFKQNDWMFFNFVNYYEDNGKALDHYFSYIDEWFREKGTKLGRIYLPHDSKQKWQSYLVAWKTIFDKFNEKYPWKVEYIPNKVSINDWIQEGRKLFSRCRFDIDDCSQFIRCIENYKKDYDDTKKVFRDQPYHDWASHWADNYRYFAVSNTNPPDTRSTLYIRDDWLDTIVNNQNNSFESNYFISV